MKKLINYVVFKDVPSLGWKRLSFYLNDYKTGNNVIYFGSLSNRGLHFRLQKRTDYAKLLSKVASKKKKDKVDEFEDQDNIVLTKEQENALYVYMSKKFVYTSFLDQKFEEILYKYIIKRRRGRIYASFFPEKYLLFYRFNNFFIKSGSGLRAFHRYDDIMCALKKSVPRAKGHTILMSICNKLFPYYVKGYLKKGKRFFFVSKDPDCNQKYVVMLTWLLKALKGKRYSMFGIHYDDVISTMLDTFKRKGNAFAVQSKFYDVIDENAYLTWRYRKKYKHPLSEYYLSTYIKGMQDEYKLNFLEKYKKKSFSLWVLKKKMNYILLKKKSKGKKNEVKFGADFADNDLF